MKAAKDKDKPSIIRWRGILPKEGPVPRWLIGALLATACASMTFSQMGFLGIGLPGEYQAYAIALLAPVALAALSLGVGAGLIMGLFAGMVLCLHAATVPLDFYELAYVTPATSILMLGISGLMLGFLFAVALRKDPPQIRRIVYVVLICILVSWLYSIGFFVNVYLQLALDAAALAGWEEPDAAFLASFKGNLMRTAFRMGDLSVQARVDAILMALPCCLADFVVRKVAAQKRRPSLHALYATWLSAVVLFAFMITAAISFAVITQQEFDSAKDAMEGEVDYLCDQLEASDNRMLALSKFLDKAGVSVDNLTESAYEDLLDSISVDSLLSGYTKEADGIVVVALVEDDVADATVLLSDDDLFDPGDRLNEVLDDQAIAAMRLSLNAGTLERITYDEEEMLLIEAGKREEGRFIKTHIAYLSAQRAGDYLVMMIRPSDKVFEDRFSVMSWTTASEFVLLLAVFVMTNMLLSKMVVRRINETNGVLGRITAGDLEARVAERGTSEFESLADGINTTVGTLKDWIAEAETRMDSELAAAKSIQERALPSLFPPYPDILRFDVYASMKAAREVGGDFYDFFLIGDDAGPDSGKLGFVVADVSGKGIPAALFMMKAKTQIRDYLANGMMVGEAVENANRQLCDGNTTGMFVTAWVGVLDYATGHVDYVNAGHNPPLLWQREGGWRWLMEKSGMPLGLFEGFPYETYSVDCEIGDQFLLYTDGVTEAMNPEGELYGEERLKELADVFFAKHPRSLVDAVRSGVTAHAAGAEQSDDITILALEVGVPPETTSTIAVPARVDQLPLVNEFIHTELDRRLCPLRTQNQLDIAVEELFVNVCHYGFPDATPEQPGTVRVSYTYSADPPSVTVDIADEGVPYNPLAKPDAETPDDIMDVPIGGLGILMAKRSVDEMRYERVGKSNVVSIVKKW